MPDLNEIPSEVSFSDDDLKPKCIPVTIGSMKCIMREASAEATISYKNGMMACTRLGPDGRPATINGLADLDPKLLSACLIQQLEGNKEKPVDIAVIRKWPDRVVQHLIKTLKKISPTLEEENETPESIQKEINRLSKRKKELEDKGDSAKNEQSAGTE
jgi:hypothetical protein